MLIFGDTILSLKSKLLTSLLLLLRTELQYIWFDEITKKTISKENILNDFLIFKKAIDGIKNKVNDSKLNVYVPVYDKI